MTPSGARDRDLAAEIATGLAAALRREEIPAPLAAVLEFARALVGLGRLDRAGVYWAGRAVFLGSPEEAAGYERAFAAYFRDGAVRPALEVTRLVEVAGPDAADADPGADGRDGDAGAAGFRFSSGERLARADLAELSEEELAEVRRLVAELEAAPALVASRRREPSSAPTARLDLRRTVALALRSDGEVVRRRYRRPRRRPRRVVVLCDVSGSMQPYARAMLRFAQVLAGGRARVEVFAMGTRLTRLTRSLRSRDPGAALRTAGGEIADWSGGTRLGETLREFNERYGARGAARSADVLICSDGIDRGDPELVAEAMARLARVARRIIWVNPLKASVGYEPLARGMAAALPYVDEFLPGESFAALEVVAAALAR